ncbi:MAG: glycoside hydrolase family 28 protein [candidate division KSB1 bacterium]|nr:glycoside hydrolase family 28 protein [candidate division KSB1 bacterium]
MKTLLNKRIYLLTLGLFVLVSCAGTPSPTTGWDQVSEILEQIKPPQFPERSFDVTDFGAQGDGVTDCTEAFVQAIAACHDSGGGRVIVPQGKYLTGAIHLKSNVNLHISDGATILFSRNLEDYLPVVYTRFEGVECMNYSPLIYGYNLENIALTGEGTLDGQADETHWWSWAKKQDHGWQEGMPHQKADRDRLFQMGEDNAPVQERVFGPGHYLRVNFIQFYRCKNILIDGLTLKRSPMWEIHPVLSENITVRNVTIDSHGPNNDGCNPESSKNILIENCYFDTGDDCIALKAGRNGDGRRVDTPTENVIIRNCRMKDGHGGVVIGSEMTGGCRNVFVEDCVMDSPNLDRALRIKTNSLRGGTVEHIYMRNVRIGQVADAILRVYFHYENGDAGDYTPVVRNIHLKNVTSEKSKYALLLEGYERSPITHIYLDSCKFNGVEQGNILNHVKDLRLSEVKINGEPMTVPEENAERI